jgi:hypothetical protein
MLIPESIFFCKVSHKRFSQKYEKMYGFSTCITVHGTFGLLHTYYNVSYDFYWNHHKSVRLCMSLLNFCTINKVLLTLDANFEAK